MASGARATDVLMLIAALLCPTVGRGDGHPRNPGRRGAVLVCRGPAYAGESRIAFAGPSAAAASCALGKPSRASPALPRARVPGRERPATGQASGMRAPFFGESPLVVVLWR